MADILAGKRVLVTGAGGFLGQHVCRQMAERGALVNVNRIDLTNLESVSTVDKPDLLIHLAADVKGITLNRTLPYSFLETNTLITLGMMQWLSLWRDVPVVAAGSICAYPHDAPLPFTEKDFWRGKPDPNNLGYGMAKRLLAGALECAYEEWGQPYAHLICANMYGPGDHFDDTYGHVIPSLIRRMDKAIKDNAPEFEIWGTGKATRDFLYVEDAAKAFIEAADAMLSTPYRCINANLGSGQEISITRLVETVANIMGYQGKLVYNTAKPDGQMRRWVDSKKADVLLDWYAPTPLRNGLERTIEWYREAVAA